ncbi:nitric oxide synthase oxygenase, partial [Alicyclobacillus acidocaldarius]|uniref:nitric oxide synthase oxygenase n=1 Tax=Alicyclobacillus acidocaldarius TaxID=405212 RepID=UPI003F53F3B4
MPRFREQVREICVTDARRFAHLRLFLSSPLGLRLLFWQSLHVFDRRHLKGPRPMFEAICEHL